MRPHSQPRARPAPTSATPTRLSLSGSLSPAPGHPTLTPVLRPASPEGDGRARYERCAVRPGPDEARHPQPVVQDAAMGRWEGARELLAATGADWDRRILRLQVLARMGRSEGMERAWAAYDAAADAPPPDPAPYVVMLALLRFHSPSRDPEWRSAVRIVWEEVEQRDRWNREAHHELLTYMFPSWHGSGGEMFHWAQERCAHALRGLPLHILPLVALAESHRLRMETEGERYGLTVHPWTDHPSTQQAWVNWWAYGVPTRPHAAFPEDANCLAHALSFANRHKAAAEVFDAISPYATDVPWSCCGAPDRRRDRRGPPGRPRPPPVRRVRVHRIRQQHRLGLRRLRRPHRPAHGPGTPLPATTPPPT